MTEQEYPRIMSRSALRGTPGGKLLFVCLASVLVITASPCSWVFPDPRVCLACSSPTFAQWDSSQECLRDKGSWACTDLETAFCFCGCFASVRTIWGHFSRQNAARLPNLDAFFTFSMCLYLCNPGECTELEEEG